MNETGESDVASEAPSLGIETDSADRSELLATFAKNDGEILESSDRQADHSEFFTPEQTERLRSIEVLQEERWRESHRSTREGALIALESELAEIQGRPTVSRGDIDEKGRHDEPLLESHDDRGLSFEEVEKRALSSVENPETFRQLVDTYRERFGNEINTDLARDLFTDYAESRENRAKFANAVQEPASSVAKAAWRECLAEYDASEPEPGYVQFMAGGGGSGKGTALHELEHQSHFPAPYAVYDTTMANLESSASKIESALESGLDVRVTYVHREIDDAVVGMIGRAVRDGRTVPVDVLAVDHYDAQRSFLSLQERYASNDAVRFNVADNSGRPDELVIGDPELLRSHLYESPESVLNRAQEAMSREITRREADGNPIPEHVVEAISRRTESLSRRAGSSDQ